MKTKKLLFLLPLVVSLAACNTGGESTSGEGSTSIPTSTSVEPTSSSEPAPTPKGEKIQVKLPAMMSDSLYVDANYSDSDFEAKSNVMNENLKVLSFAASCATASISDANAFYTTMGYDNVFYAGYEQITADSIGYIIAHKSFGSYDVVSITIRGFNYGKEWINNFTVGSEGNHTGFDASANEIYEKLNEYISKIGDKTIKLWVTGYSRGGGVANVLASKLLKEREEIKVEKDNVFVYTYEAPRGLIEENAVAYDNVFNFVNDIDPIARLLPEEYGLYRCGTDVVINKDKDMDEALKALDPTLSLPAFTPMETPYKFANEKELIDVLLNGLLEEYEGAEDVSMATREKYATNIEPSARYLIEFFMDLPQNVLNEFMNTFKNFDKSIVMQWLFTDNGLYSVILKPILDKSEYAYDAEKLEPACNVADRLLKTKLSLIAAFIDTATLSINQQMVDNVMRVAGMHYPETVYALIK